MIQSVGKLTVVTPGTPVAASPGVVTTLENQIHAILFQALPTNTGKIYIGSAVLNKTALTGVYAILPVPTSNLLPTFSAALTYAPNALRLADFYVDADVADEGVICTVLVT